MNCSLCGEVCRCHQEPSPSALSASQPDARDSSALSEATILIAPTADSSAETGSDAEENSAWRDELSARLDRYRARRQMRPPRYPSLRLPFDNPEPQQGSAVKVSAPPSFEPVSQHALALDRMIGHHPAADADVPIAPEPVAQTAPLTAHPSGHSAKIIEFPRFAWGPPPPLPDQLAEPVSERPRILEVPEVAPPPPALGGITIEAEQRREAEKRPGIDIPLQSASLARRVAASAVDGLIVAMASGLFGFIFWKVAAVRPPIAQIVELAAAVPCIFWAAYQYLLIVYAGTTPGLRAAGLELAHFDGTRTNRSLRRWRVLAAWLSGVSLGMGYAWVFLDEDVLCWHDRITHTYLAPGKR